MICYPPPCKLREDILLLVYLWSRSPTLKHTIDIIESGRPKEMTHNKTRKGLDIVLVDSSTTVTRVQLIYTKTEAQGNTDVYRIIIEEGVNSQ